MMNRDVIIACDFASREATLEFLDRFPEGRKPFVKIGMELFYAEGPSIVRDIKARGHKIFLDLKLHDIPNTVKKAMRVLSALDVDMVNVHAAGTVAMMQAALEGLTRPDGTRPLLIAVTQLTSTSQEVMQDELLIGATINDTIVKYAQNAREAGLDGVVCSPLEAGMVKQACGEGFLTVTPGIRFADAGKDDQVRITTPARAREIGSDFCHSEQSERIYMERQIASSLLSIGAVFLRPEQPFTWASGIKSPIYCDNRLTLSAPRVREQVENGLAKLVKRHYPDCEMLMGTSTAGIAHAAITATILDLPMGYVRGEAKTHGRTNRIEGKMDPGTKVVVIEDLISTGGSAIEVVEALREAGAEVLGIVSIFTYGMKRGLERIAAANTENHSLCNLDVLVDVAEEEGRIGPGWKERILAFRDNPSDESWIKY